jgi:hypothetical protein
MMAELGRKKEEIGLRLRNSEFLLSSASTHRLLSRNPKRQKWHLEPWPRNYQPPVHRHADTPERQYDPFGARS